MGLQHFVACEEYAWEDGGSLGCEKVLRAVVQSICSPLPGSNRRPFGYRPNALPLSQGGDGQILMRLCRATASQSYAWEYGGSLGCEKVLHAVVQSICSPPPCRARTGDLLVTGQLLSATARVYAPSVVLEATWTCSISWRAKNMLGKMVGA